MRDESGSHYGQVQINASRKRVLLLLRRVFGQVPGKSRENSFFAAHAHGIRAGLARIGTWDRTRVCQVGWSNGWGREERRADLCVSHVRGSQTSWTRAMSEVWDGVGARVAGAARDQDRVDVPDASGDYQAGAGQLSDLRYGARAAHGNSWGRRE